MPQNNRPALCPYATATTARNQTTLNAYLLSIGCRRWDCTQCAALRKAHLVRRIVAARPNRFITLTCRHDGTPEQRLHEIKRGLTRLTAELRKQHEFEYARMLEQCQDGFPHFHLLARSPFIPQPELKKLWARFTTATIVDIRKAYGASASYVAKYITKARDKDGNFGRQRLSVTRKFWPTNETLNELGAFVHHDEHPTAWAQRNQYAITLITRGPTRWLITEREPGDELPEELQPWQPNQDDEW